MFLFIFYLFLYFSIHRMKEALWKSVQKAIKFFAMSFILWVYKATGSEDIPIITKNKYFWVLSEKIYEAYIAELITHTGTRRSGPIVLIFFLLNWQNHTLELDFFGFRAKKLKFSHQNMKVWDLSTKSVYLV